MDTAVNRCLSVFTVGIAKVKPSRTFIITRYMNGMFYEFSNSFIFAAEIGITGIPNASSRRLT